jgi:hypothetical protein
LGIFVREADSLMEAALVTSLIILAWVVPVTLVWVVLKDTYKGN